LPDGANVLVPAVPAAGVRVQGGRDRCCTSFLLVAAIFAAQRSGLVDLIARGYRVLAALILVTFVLPLLTFGLWRLVKGRPATPANA